MTNEEYGKLAAKAAGATIDSNGKPIFTSREQNEKYSQILKNLHKIGIDKNSTPKEIAAASVGIKISKNANPTFVNRIQYQDYCNALKNITSNTQNGVTDTVNHKYTPEEIKQMEKEKGTKYVWEHVYNGDTSKYDPYKRASQMLGGIPLIGNEPYNCGPEGKKAFEAALYGTGNKSEFSQPVQNTLIGTTNEKFVYINPVINNQQSVFKNNIEGAAGYAAGKYNQGQITATKEEQQYLYNLSEKTGMDYPLLLGIWCSENVCKPYPDAGKSGGTMGLTFDISFIESGYIHDDGNGKTYNNNYKEQIEKLVEETYIEVYGKTPSDKEKSANSIYYDSAVTCLLLTNTMYSPIAGGSNKNDSAWDAYTMYCNDFTRASEYADSIRKNMGWSNVDYENAMSQAHPETKLIVNYN